MPRRQCHLIFDFINSEGIIVLNPKKINNTMQINTSEPKSRSYITEKLTMQKDKNYLFSLDNLSALAICGENSDKYLQGQLTCDVNKVTSSVMQPGALCNIKGRVITLLNAIVWNKTYYLILNRDLQEKVQKTLQKTAMFSKVKIDSENDFKIFGFYLQNKNDIILNLLPEKQYEVVYDENYCCYSLTDQLFIVITSTDAAHNLISKFPDTQIRNTTDWHMLQLQSSIYTIYPETSGIFLPHRLNLQNTSYMSFTKGCFIGQEIIARTQYLAKLKHGMYLYTFKSKETIFSGQKIYSEDGAQEIGEVVDVVLLPNNEYLAACSLLFNHQQHVKFEDNQDLISLHHSALA